MAGNLSTPLNGRILLPSGSASGVTLAAPFQLRNIAGANFFYHQIEIENVINTAGIVNFAMLCQYVQGSTVESGASDYSTYGSAGKTSFGELTGSLANPAVGEFRGDFFLNLMDFLDATKNSRINGLGYAAYTNSANAPQVVNLTNMRNTAKVNDGLNIYPSAGTMNMSFNWKLYGVI